MPDSPTKPRSQVKDLGASLSGIFDMAKCKQCREPVKLNEATIFVMNCVLQAVRIMPLGVRAHGFIALAGESRFLRTDFPPPVRTAVDGQVEHMTKTLLSQASISQIAISGDLYSVVLGLFSNREEARSWIETQNGSRHPPSAVGRNQNRPNEEIADSVSKIPLALAVNAETDLARSKKIGQDGKDEIEGSGRDVRKAKAIFEGALIAVAETLPQEYAARHAELAELSDAFRVAAGNALQPSLNAYLETQERSTYDDKKVLCKWVNAELRRLGLAIRCPNSGQASLLQANPGNRPAEGRFQLARTDAEGRTHQTFNSQQLFSLELMPDDLVRAPYGGRNSRGR